MSISNSNVSDEEFDRLIEESRIKNEPNNPEFDNFLQRVNEISSIVKGLTSNDKTEVSKATCQADIYLHSKDDNVTYEDCQVKLDKSSINLKAFQAGPPKKTDSQQDTMDPQAFMAYIEKDANERHQDRKERKSISDAYKKRGNEAFRNKDYEKALHNYNKAITEIKDSGVLYTNRALCCIHLKLFKRAVSDCEWALKVNEKNLKALLYKGKAHHYLGEKDESAKCIKEAEATSPECKDFIEQFVSLWDPIVRDIEN